jgi:beta-lactamase class C
MNLKRWLSSLMIIWPSISCAAASVQDPYAAQVAKVIQTTMTKYHIPGVAVELVIDGKPYEYYFGVASRDTNEPVTRKTIFELGSISKVMTGLLVAQEIDWAKMSLSDPIKKYLKDLPDSFHDMKIQDLATHTAGLPLSISSEVQNKEEVMNYLNSWKAEYHPEEEWIYSHLGVGLLGYALEASTEKSYDKLYYRHVMLPLTMVNGVEVPPGLQKYYAQGYTQSDQTARRVNTNIFPGAYGVKASASDMQKFLRAAIGLPGTPERVLYPMRLTQSVFMRIGKDFQGLGWQIHPIINHKLSPLKKVSDRVEFGPMEISEIYQRPTYDGDALIDKTGTTNGFRAYIAVLPNRKSGIVILANKNVPNTAIVKPARELLLDLL